MIFKGFFTKRFFNKTRKIQLNAKEKSEVRDELIKFMKKNPTIKETKNQQEIPRPL